MTVLLNASAVGGVINTQNTGVVQVPANGIISVDPRDVSDLLRLGCTIVANKAKMQAIAAPLTASSSRLFASAALSAGTLAIAAQVDVARQVQAVVNPGTLAITNGVLSLTYVANDGTTQTDNLNLVTAASTNVTVKSTKGVQQMVKQVVTAVTGGVTPGIQIGINAYLAVPVDPGAGNFAEVAEYLDGLSVATMGTAAPNGLITPATAPNGTHNYVFGYTYQSN